MLAFQIDTNSATPLYEQIYNSIRRYILDGTLTTGTRLPSTRGLSTTLNVSRNTVDTAYYQLMSEGFIEPLPKSGFYVSDISLSDFHIKNKTQNHINTKPVVDEQTDSGYTYDFSPFSIDLSHFPYSIWKKLSRQSLDDDKNLFLLGDNFGDISLRSAICNYVRLSREVSCDPEQIIIGAGADYLLQMLCLTFKHTGCTEVTMENPCYMKAAQIFKSNDINVHTGILDKKGLMVSSISQGSNVVYVTPSHEYPLGLVMPFGRRKELLDWAYADDNRYIIEDDHDSEFRYKGKPIPALQGLEDSSKVIYFGTFSKSVAPALRVAYMILPPSLLARYQDVCGHYSCTVSRLDQTILTRFLTEGYFEKHVNRMRKIYKQKHDTVMEILEPYIDNGTIKVIGENAGLHLVILLPPGRTEQNICSDAAAHSIHIYGLKKHYLKVPDNAPEALLLGYSNLTTDEITDGLNKLISSVGF